jgi:V/A-type H+/Na+-transporting ATPase subunit A
MTTVPTAQPLPPPRPDRTGGAPRGGIVDRVDGPLVEVIGLDDASMSELLRVGPSGLLAEVVSISPDRVSTQAYEYTGGLRPGDAVVQLDHPLSARLGPGLLGGVFDGLLRPLDDAGTWLEPGQRPSSGSPRAWAWTPTTTPGSTVGPGEVLGHVAEGPLEHRILVPSGVAGVVGDVHDEGSVTGDDTVATVAGVPVSVRHWWQVRRPRPVTERREATAPLQTGQRVVDVLFPLARGSTAAVPGGFGTGKTMLLQQIAKWCDADVIVYVGCGERGNEMADVLDDLRSIVDPRTGRPLMERTVIVANTSNMPMMAREASIYAAVTVAEYYRDMGYDAIVIADSTSRWAEALREFSSRTGALPAEEGYPASLASALAAFYERAGRVRTLGGADGSVTIIGAVSPQGGDLTEPVTAHTERFVRTLWALDRDLAYARHYPAVSWLGSFSRDADVLAAWHAGRGDASWARQRARLEYLLGSADRLADLAELMGVAALPGHERMVLLGGRLVREGLLQQSALSGVDAWCGPERSAALVSAVLDVLDACVAAVDRGVPAASVEEVDFTPVLLAREGAPGEGEEARRVIATARDAVLAQVEALS